MPELHWQKSTYSQEASACVYLAAAPTGTILLRESDVPETILTTTGSQIGALISALKSRPREHVSSRQGRRGTAEVGEPFDGGPHGSPRGTEDTGYRPGGTEPGASRRGLPSAQPLQLSPEDSA